ncbi:hypothetical protein NC652_027789 [Populus alba x Populus x berolinensis]|nr:hypothetical protein NC652_027789 [Populus alba x Populus x berolinensis]
MSNLVYNSSKLSLSLAAKRDDEEEAQLSPCLSVSLLPFVLRTTVDRELRDEYCRRGETMFAAFSEQQQR